MKNGKLILKEIVSLSDVLLRKPKDNLRSISSSGGVYLIRREGKIIYVGKAKNLLRRINSDHISGENRNTTSTVRRKVTRKFGIPHGKKLRQWMSECTFSTIEVSDSDMRTLVESYLICLLRKKGEPLLND